MLLAMIAVRFLLVPSFLLKGPTSKKNTWNRLFLMDSAFMSLKKIMKLVFLPSSSMIIKQAMSLIAMEFYGHPEKQLKLLAFTGTKGKTTAAYFAYHILEQSHRPAMLSHHEYNTGW